MKFQIIVDIQDKNVPISNSYKEIKGYHDRTEQECIDYITWALEKKLNGFKIDTITRVKDSNKNENEDQEGCDCPVLHTRCDYNYEEDCQEGCMQIKNNEKMEREAKK